MSFLLPTSPFVCNTSYGLLLSSKKQFQLRCSRRGRGTQVCEEFPSMEEIMSAGGEAGMNVERWCWGPYFRFVGRSREGKELGRVDGLVRIWRDGRILHLESARMSPLSLKHTRPLLGLAFLLGAASIRHGYDCECTKAELLAVNDNDMNHSKLCRYYSRMGFKIVYEVTGDSWRDVPHMLMWGATGTRMDADIFCLLKRWSPAFRQRLLALVDKF